MLEVGGKPLGRTTGIELGQYSISKRYRRETGVIFKITSAQKLSAVFMFSNGKKQVVEALKSFGAKPILCPHTSYHKSVPLDVSGTLMEGGSNKKKMKCQNNKHAKKTPKDITKGECESR